MVLRLIMKYLANNEQLINKIADSRPIRRAAQFVVYLIHRSSAAGQSYHISDNSKELANRLKNVLQRFSSDVKKGIEEAKEEIKKKQSK